MSEIPQDVPYSSVSARGRPDFVPLSKPGSQPAGPAEAREDAGLCSTCVNAAACTYTTDPARPVLQCDEYMCLPAPGFSAACRANPSRGPLNRRHEAKRGDEDMGLCSHCAGRDTCAFPIPEGGVWHCEEYR